MHAVSCGLVYRARYWLLEAIGQTDRDPPRYSAVDEALGSIDWIDDGKARRVNLDRLHKAGLLRQHFKFWEVSCQDRTDANVEE
jgi:hypothetical protein